MAKSGYLIQGQVAKEKDTVANGLLASVCGTPVIACHSSLRSISGMEGATSISVESMLVSLCTFWAQ